MKETRYYSMHEHAQMLLTEIAKWPAEFGLRAFPGEIFKISVSSSYFSRLDSTVPTLYTARKQPDGTWRDFAKGTPSELRREMVALKGVK